jgi:hypothetical protein
MLGMGKPVHIFQLGASGRNGMAAIAVIDAQEKKKKNKHSLLKKSTYSIGSAFINYKQSIFRQNTNQMIAHLQGKLVEKTPTHVIIDCV